jgi:hypothetical protein
LHEENQSSSPPRPIKIPLRDMTINPTTIHGKTLKPDIQCSSKPAKVDNVIHPANPIKLNLDFIAY